MQHSFMLQRKNQIVIAVSRSQLKDLHLFKLVAFHVGLQPKECPGIGFESNNSACGPNQMSGHQAEESPVGPDINETHSGPQNSPRKGAFLRFIAAGEEDLGRDIVAEKTLERIAAQFSGHPGHKWFLAAAPKPANDVILA